MQYFINHPAGRLLLCSVILWLAPALRAQISAPNLTCTNTPVGEVELVWTNVAETCGAYEATEVFRAPSVNGPFVRIAEVTDLNATTYRDPNPTGGLRYYFLRYRYDCPGLTPLNSDTLETLPLRTPSINYVEIEENEIVINWRASLSPEVSGYTILEAIPTGFVTVGTVGNVTEFRLPFGPGDTPPASREFRLVAFDACGNESAQTTSAAALRLTGTGGGGCTNVVTLEVDQERLSGFLPTTGLELFVSYDGGDFVSAGTFSPRAETVPFREASNGQFICFYVEGILRADEGRIRSEPYCLEVRISQPIRQFSLYGVEVDDTGELRFQYDDGGGTQPAPVLSQLVLTRRTNLLEVAEITDPVFDNGGELSLPGPAEAAISGDDFRFRLTDSCGREVTTNAVEPVYLSASNLLPGTNQLIWTPLKNGLAGTITYDVFREVAGMMPVRIATNLTDTLFNDTEVAAGGDEVCYRIEARYTVTGNAPAPFFLFNSNRVCVLPTAGAYVPNAFSPNAMGEDNRVFRPFFSVPVSAEGYEFLIFDRWGGLLFQSADPAEGWDGSAKGQVAVAGTYLYVLKFRAGEGDFRQRSGTVNLLR